MASNVSTSIAQAVNFLTRPLTFVYAPAMIQALQTVLRSNLHAASVAAPNKRLMMAFTASVPPRHIYATCIVMGIQWADWFDILGQREFDLIIEANKVSVRYHSQDGSPSQTTVVWTETELTPAKRSLLARLNMSDVPAIPISKLGQQSSRRPSIIQPRVSPVSIPIQHRTLAQQLLDSDHESEDELFAMISKPNIISPTPTRESFALPEYTRAKVSLPFAAPVSRLSSPEVSSPESSRPSSRSSTFSTYSFTDDESITSASSFTSTSKSSDVSASSRDAVEPKVYVDSNKKQVTKYLYQGGVSQTLTGGVMLGVPKNVAPKPTATNNTPKYRPPMAAKKFASNGASWRRAPGAPPRARA